MSQIWASSWENRLFAYAKTKTQISFVVTAKLISAFVFAKRIVQSFYFLNLKAHASSHLLWVYSPVCVRPGWKPRRPVFSQRGSYYQDPLQVEPDLRTVLSWHPMFIYILTNAIKLSIKLTNKAHVNTATRSDSTCSELSTVKFLNFRTPEIFAVIYLKFKQKAKILGYLVKKMPME